MRSPVRPIAPLCFCLLILFVTWPLASARASFILSPSSALVTSAFLPIGNTFDQSGLSDGFISGADDFDAYIAMDPMHTFVASDNEWFTANGVTSATILYDLGAAFFVDRLALWNEESAGIGSFDVLVSTNLITFSPVATGLMPTNNLNDAPYPAQVFDLTPSTARYVRLDVSGCPQAPSTFAGCAMGEIAFSAVPEPNSFALLGLGLVLLVAERRRFLG